MMECLRTQSLKKTFLKPWTMASFQSVYFIPGFQLDKPIYEWMRSESSAIPEPMSALHGGVISVWGFGEKKNA